MDLGALSGGVGPPVDPVSAAGPPPEVSPLRPEQGTRQAPNSHRTPEIRIGALVDIPENGLLYSVPCWFLWHDGDGWGPR